MLHQNAHAQCDTFYNADAANLITNVYPFPTTFTGVDFVDIDGDGDPDFYFGGALTSMRLFKNIGTKEHPVLQPDTSDVSPSGFESLPSFFQVFQFVDIDGDGDYDCFISDYPGAKGFTTLKLHYYKNIGSSAKPDFVNDDAHNPFANISVSAGYNNLYFAFADIDKDGDMDFAYQSSSSQTDIYLNKGTKTKPKFVLYNHLSYLNQSGPCFFYDWNKDGLPDYFANGRFFQNTGTLRKPYFESNVAAGPVFTNGTPLRFFDINSDGAPEAYTIDGNYSTIAPVPVIDTSLKKIGNVTIVKYESAQQMPGYKYTWLYKNKPMADGHKPFIYALRQGNYTLEITNDCGTGLSIPHYTYDRFATHLLAGNEKISLPSFSAQNADVKTYPNPFNSEFTLQIPTNTGLKNTIKITDLAGRTMLTQTTAGGTLQTGSTLTKGVYILQVWQNNTLVYQTKIVKQ